MITVSLINRLGNQMFQYALGKRLSILHKTTLKIEIVQHIRWSEYLKKPSHFNLLFYTNNYALDIFNINVVPHVVLWGIKNLPKKWTQFLRTTIVREKQFAYDNRILTDTPDNAYLVGNWQSPKYFLGIEQLIRKDFTFKKPILSQSQEILKKIQSTCSVCLHVRRGDYLIYAKHNVISNKADYFYNATQYMAEKLGSPLHLFVFSDDLMWCKENIKIPHPTIFVDESHAGEKDGNHLQMMTHCKHFIISNSTFSWWAAWLCENPQKIVIAPKKWFNNKNADALDLIPKDWIRF